MNSSLAPQSQPDDLNVLIRNRFLCNIIVLRRRKELRSKNIHADVAFAGVGESFLRFLFLFFSLTPATRARLAVLCFLCILASHSLIEFSRWRFSAFLFHWWLLYLNLKSLMKLPAKLSIFAAVRSPFMSLLCFLFYFVSLRFFSISLPPARLRFKRWVIGFEYRRTKKGEKKNIFFPLFVGAREGRKISFQDVFFFFLFRDANFRIGNFSKSTCTSADWPSSVTTNADTKSVGVILNCFIPQRQIQKEITENSTTENATFHLALAGALSLCFDLISESIRHSTSH